jgi:hypothetical protein
VIADFREQVLINWMQSTYIASYDSVPLLDALEQRIKGRHSLSICLAGSDAIAKLLTVLGVDGYGYGYNRLQLAVNGNDVTTFPFASNSVAVPSIDS